MSNSSHSAAHQAPPIFTTDTMLSISDLVALRPRGKGKDRKTITKQIHGGRYPNAVQDPDGVKSWSVPIKDLVAAGDLDPAQVVEVAASLESARETKQVSGLRSRIVELETNLAAQTARAEERQSVITTLQSVVTGLLAAQAPSSMTRGVS